MRVPIGFVLLINPFNPVAQSARLIETLNRMFDRPPIACHHDFGKNLRFIEGCPNNVRLVRPHVDTKWGDFSCVEAMIKALQLLYEDGEKPKWFVFLSGSDYPIKPANHILEELEKGQFDAYIEHKVVSDGDLSYPPDPLNLQGWKHETWLQQCHRRYCSLRLDVPGINRYLRPSKRTFWLESSLITRGRLPFSPQLKCYAGEVWFSASDLCAHRILEFYNTDRRVTAHYRKTLVPEESYVQTILGNSADLRLSQNYRRYVDWTNRASNPRILTCEDLPALARSDAHFARKFDEKDSGDLLDKIDELIGLRR